LQAKHFGTGNCSFRKEEAMAIGLLDERFRYYGGEDTDFGARLKRLGVRILFCEDARGEHYDTVNLNRYKEKITQLARNGLKISIEETPELIEASRYRFLLPYNRRRDSMDLIFIKFVLRLMTFRRFLSIAERFAMWSDRKPNCYCTWLYYYLTSGWTITGLAEPPSDEETVVYRDSPDS
jgi:GT2 family glycosyltransferase